MITVDARSLVYAFKEFFLPFNEVNQIGPWPRLYCRGILVSFNVSLWHRESTTKGTDQKRVITVLVAGHHTAFVTDCFDWKNNLDTFENVGNHDSCWIESVQTKLMEIYFAMCKEVDDDTAPRDLNQFTSLGLFGDAPRLVEVELELDKERNVKHGSDYWRKVKTLKTITKEEFYAFGAKK